MCLRALDYCPPVDVQFGDFLRALITADHDLVPDDPYGYRASLIERRDPVTLPPSSASRWPIWPASSGRYRADLASESSLPEISEFRNSRPHRAEGWNLFIPSVWTDVGDSDENIAWTRESFAALRPHFGAGRWLNYLGDDEADDAVHAAYGPNYERLREVKRRYDPENVFHLNHNIR